jgi:cell cycle checkpoint protein
VLDAHRCLWAPLSLSDFSKRRMSCVSDDYTRGGIESLSTKFSTFLARASSCQSIFDRPTTLSAPLLLHSQKHSQSSDIHSSQTHTQSQPGTHAVSSQPSSSGAGFLLPPEAPRHLVLLEDLPNLLHAPTQAAFHAALDTFLATPAESAAPVVLVISDAGVRGEATDERLMSGGLGKGKEVVDVRTVIPKAMLDGPFVTQIAYVTFHISCQGRLLTS